MKKIKNNNVAVNNNIALKNEITKEITPVIGEAMKITSQICQDSKKQNNQVIQQTMDYIKSDNVSNDVKIKAFDTIEKITEANKQIDISSLEIIGKCVAIVAGFGLIALGVKPTRI